MSIVFDRALILRISKTIILALQLRPIRSVYDDSGVVSHVVHTLRYKKPTFIHKDRFSKALEQRLALEFGSEYTDLEVSESKVIVHPPLGEVNTVQARYYSGRLVLNLGQAFVFSLDPAGTLTVRQLTEASYDFTVI